MQHVLPEINDAWNSGNLTKEDAAAISFLVEHDNHHNRRKIEALVTSNPVFRPYYNTSLDEQREHALRKLKAFCGENVIRVQDFEENPSNIFMAHETFAQVDGAFATKMTVQFNLFGGTVFR